MTVSYEGKGKRGHPLGQRSNEKKTLPAKFCWERLWGQGKVSAIIFAQLKTLAERGVTGRIEIISLAELGA